MRRNGPSLKFKYELLLAFFVIIVIPLFFVVFIHSRQLSRITEEQSVQFMQQVTDQLNKNIEKSIREIDRIQFFYIFDYELMKIMKKDKPNNNAEDEEYVKDNLRITQHFLQICGTNEDIMTVFVHTTKGNEFSIPLSIEVEPELKEKLMRHAETNPRNLFLVLTGTYNYANSVEDVITIGRGSIDPYTNKLLGYTMVNISYKIFEKLFENLNSDPRLSVFVHNGEKILYHSQKDKIKVDDFKDVIKQSYKKNVIQKVNISGKRCLVVSNYCEYTGLTTVEYVPMTLINQSAVKNSQNYWQVTLIIFILAMILSATIAYRISNPISRLEKAMTALKENREFGIIQNQVSTRELWSLTQSYNATVLATKEWMEKEQQYQKNKRKLELLTLELQINPHFLYNTLGLISSKAYINEQSEIVEVTKNLSELLRFNLKEKQIITLSEELEQVKRYIQIQKLGMSREFIIMFDIDPGFDNQEVLKATIQPLVENSIVHGFGGDLEYGLLKISTKNEKNDLLIAITDNGKGMDETQVHEINEQLKQPIDAYMLSNEKKHIGLKNVQYRIWQQFGEPYGLTVESIKNIGTTVYVRLPLTIEGCEDK